MYLTLAIAVYNGENVLSQMVDSILMQSFRDYELLLLDDGSTDASSVLCDSYAQKDSRVRVVHKENGGLCSCRNLAIRLAKGSHICFLDQDDKIFPGMLAAFAEAIMQRTADFYLCGYQTRIEDSKGAVIERRLVFAPDSWLASAEEVRKFYLEHLSSGVVAPIWNIVYSLEFLRSNQLQFDESLRMSLDDFSFHTQDFFLANRVQVLSNIGIEYYARNVKVACSSSRKYNPKYQSQCSKVLLELQRKIKLIHEDDNIKSQIFYSLCFRVYIIPTFQNLIYARKKLGKEQVLQELPSIMRDPLAGETIRFLNNSSAWKCLLKHERLLFRCILKERYIMLYRLFIIKDCIYGSRFLPIVKKFVR